jgi:hypothetical protein
MQERELGELARWFGGAAAALEDARARLAELRPGTTPVRCWPHHFDIAMLLSLAAGHSETAPAIGIGLSPGDDHYGQPYFYVSPWPAPPVDSLPSLPTPGHWHTQGFIGAIVPADALLTSRERRTAIRCFIDETIELSRRVLAV